jgi:hypothetical protein
VVRTLPDRRRHLVGLVELSFDSVSPVPRRSAAPQACRANWSRGVNFDGVHATITDERDVQKAMARRTIHFSDLSSQPILDDADVVRVVVIDHPALSGDAVEFEAAASELTDIDQGPLDVAVIELHPAGDKPSRRVILDAARFDKLAVDQPMEELLRNATPIRSGGRAERATASRGTGRADYASLDHAGSPHRGRVTEAEAQLVRENLDIVNARLVASGQRTIDPADPSMRERYGFEVTNGEADGGREEPGDAATPPGDAATSSTHNAEPTVIASTQRSSSAATSAAGHRRSSAESTRSAPGAASS